MSVDNDGDYPARFIVSLHGADGRPVGLGMVGGPRQIITSAIVVNRALGRRENAADRPDESIEVRFPRRDGRESDVGRFTAVVVRWAAPPRDAADPAADDFAGLEIDRELPEGVLSGRLAGRPAAHGTLLHLFGYPSDATKASGALATVRVVGEVQRPHIHVIADQAVAVEERFAGSPAFDPGTGTVLGLLVPPRAADNDDSRYLLSAQRIRQLWPDLSARTAGISLLHLSDLRIGSGSEPQPGLLEDIESQIETSEIRPDLVLVSGDLTATGDMVDYRSAFHWLDSLGARVNVPRSKFVLIPGETDISRAFMAKAYETELVMDVRPSFPHAYKWRPLAAAMDDFYRGTGRASFDPGRPWSVHVFPDERVVAAAANSTMALSHESADQYGCVTREQVDDLAEQLTLYRTQGWLRLAAVHHHPRGTGNRTTSLLDGDVLLGGLGDDLVDLILHGHAIDARTTPHPAEPLLLGAGGTGRRYQLLRIDPTGFDRVARRRDERAEWTDDHSGRVARRLDFVLSGPGPAAGGTGSHDFLERVRTATVARGHALLDETGRPADILIRQDETALRPELIRALDGPATREAVDSFATLVRLAALDRAAARPVLVHAGPQADAALANHADDLGIDLVTLADYQRITDLTPVLNRQRDRLAADPPDYLPQEFRWGEAGAGATQHDDLEAQIGSWLAADAPRTTLVRGDPGSGKTMLLRRLARHFPAAATGAVPLLIDLAWADARTATLDALLVRHLFDNGMRNVNLDKIRYMVFEGRVALLVDGLDDLAQRAGHDQAERLLRNLVDSATRRTKLVVALGPHWTVPASEKLRLVTLAELSADRIEQYLRTRFGDAPAVFQARIDLLGRYEHLTSLVRNPRMLFLLAQLGEEALTRAAEADTSAAIYRELLESSARADPDGRRDAADRVAQWSGLALAMAENATRELRPAPDGDFGPIVRRTYDTLSFVDDSIVEWLAADSIARAWPDDALLQRIPLTELMAEFVVEVIGPDAAREWSELRHRPDGSAHGNAALLRRRLAELAARQPVPPPSATGHEDLHDQDLRKEDLGRRRLVGADLRGANLQGKVLNGIDLTGADLRGADLRGVQLIGGTLRDATLTGSRWNGAFLAGTEGVRDDAAELDAAALLPRDEPALQVVVGGMVQCLAVSSLTGLIAVGRGDIVEIIERVTGRPGTGLHTIRQFPGHISTVRDVAFAGPGDQWVISGSEDGTVRTWNLNTGGQVFRPIEAHPQPVNAVAVAGDRIITGSADGTTRMWSLNGEAIDFPEGDHSGEILSLAVAPDGRTLVTASADMTAVVRDLTDGAELFLLEHGDAVTAVAYSHDGTLIATAANNGEAIIWTAEAGERRTTLPVGGSLTSIAFSRDDRMIAVGRGDGSTWLWDVADQEPKAHPLTALTGHADRVTAVAFTDGDVEVITAAHDGTVRAWTAGTARLVNQLDSDTYWASGLAFRRDPDALRLFASTWDGAVATWNLTHGRAEPPLGQHVGALAGIAVHGDLVAAGQLLDPPVVMLWDTARQQVAELKGHDDGITEVAFSPDGKLLASTSEDRSVMIWDVAGKKMLSRLRHDGDVVSGLAFKPPGPTDLRPILAVGHGRVVRLWDAARGELVSGVELEHDRLVTAIAFLHSNRIVTATRAHVPTIRHLSDPNATPIPLRGHTGAVNCVAVAPDDSKLATGSSDNSVRIFDTRGRSIAVLQDPRAASDPGHAGGVIALAFSPNGRLLASAARDNTVRIWDTTTRRLLATLHVLRDSASLIIRADGAYRLTGDAASGVWWALRRNRFELNSIARHITWPKPLADEEWLIPPETLGSD